MAKQLLTDTIAAPGFLGLNTQESSIQLSSGFALVAQNCVIDRYGRIGSRRGWTPLNAANVDLGSNNIEFVFEMVDPANGNTVISGGNNKLFFGTTTLVTKAVRNATNDGDLSYTISDNNWQAASLPYGDGVEALAHAYIVQSNHEPLVCHELGTVDAEGNHSHDGAVGLQRLGDVGALPPGYSTADFKPNCVLAAYGRIWMADIIGDRQTVYFSQLLNGSLFNGGDSGSISINSVFPNNDQIIGLAAHNGFLIIFGRNNIAVYANPIDVTQLTLVDFISNVGCVARDSIVNTGTDILFLSDNGLRSLQRVVQEKSLPMRDLSRNVRDDLINNVISESAIKIKGVYYERDAFYLLALPATQFVYCFDMRAPLQDGTARVTIWDNIEPHAFFVNEDKELLIGKDGYVGKYYGYEDNTSAYRLRYFTNYFDFNQPTNIKVLKKAGFVVIGGSNQPISVKYGFDYSDNYLSITKTVSGAQTYQYNIDEYGVAATTSETQTESTITHDTTHYVVDFSTTSTGDYNTPYSVWLDDDGYYYIADTSPASRTAVTLYLKSSDYLAEYSGGIVLDKFTANLGGSGAVMQLGLEANIDGNPLSIQKIDVGVKLGKTVI